MQRILLAPIVAVALGGWASAAFSQMPAAAPGQELADVFFEVASVKEDRRSRQEALRPTLNMHPSGHFRASWVTLKAFIMATYGVRAYEIVDGPDWMETDRFDIVAKAPEDFEMGHTRAMMRRLLEERFALDVRKEMRRVPTYSLEWAGRSRKPGPGIRPPSPSCDDFPPRASRTLPADPRRAPPRQSECEGLFGYAVGRIFLRRSTLAPLASLLEREIGRPVIDKTGLKGLYDVDVRWSPEPRPEFDDILGGVPDFVVGGAAILTAVREQLGLDLEPTNSEIEVLVIKRVERPTEN